MAMLRYPTEGSNLKGDYDNNFQTIYNVLLSVRFKCGINIFHLLLN